jgi:tetratricopeptide (TPR) repeat protein
MDDNKRSMIWALGAVVLVALMGAFMVTLNAGAPAPASGPTSGPALSAAEYAKKGNDLYGQGRFAEAIDQYQQALKLDPANSTARVNLGNAFFSVDRLDEAAATFTEALKAAPNDADIHSNLSAVLLRQGKVDQALSEALTAVKLKPDLAEGHYILGVIYRQDNKNSLALEAFKQAAARTTDARLKSEAEKQIAELQKLAP